jgi:hypothetical protein
MPLIVIELVLAYFVISILIDLSKFGLNIKKQNAASVGLKQKKPASQKSKRPLRLSPTAGIK